MRTVITAAALVLVTAAQPIAAKQAATAPAPAFQSDRIAVTVVGKGPDVILIPGLSSSPVRAWQATVYAVPGYRYHLVQVKGFAGVPAEANATGPVAAPVAEEIARYIRERKLGRPAIIGHSMGGTIGLMLAARHPEAVGRLMVVDMAPFMGAFFGQPNATAETMRPMAEQIRAGMSGPSTPQGEAMQEQTINGMVNTVTARPAILADSRASDRRTSANAFYELLTTDLRPELANIKAPTTVLFVRPAAAPISDAQMEAAYHQLYANLAGVKLVRVPDSAHFIQIDAPARFREELKAFLR